MHVVLGLLEKISDNVFLVNVEKRQQAKVVWLCTRQIMLTTLVLQQ